MARLQVTEVFRGISMPGQLHTQESLHAATNFQFQDTDVLLVTFPKSGTTWMQQILSLIFNKEDLQNIQSIPTWARVPWIEQIYLSNYLPQVEASKPRLFTTHFPAKLLIHNLKNSKARVVYLARNPKDVLVSYYHFHKLAKFLPEIGSFDDFFDQFLEGKVNFGSWFNHIKEWLGVQQDLNFFLITYEDLSQDPHGAVQSLCNFLDQQLESKELENILHYCSFSFMSQNEQLNYSLIPSEVLDHSMGKFMRKGVTRNWKEYFSPEQNARFNNVYQAEMGDLAVKLPWSLD
ncbi:sulfotransferase 2B1-like [Phascolarctos cinereus]|uniref:Sulfotransferase n=1 Tax=Phascolarctos cinereus TaxID=38626 RepID=A0A6P5KJI9_PHACI|nr:sulfotransferase family cytosolic 2B member 1-like [Phascolarctos cinereus]XP_020844785.1 sulfotransferase family cytosolic 2B member 1-like [Phascolarctos cinereus]XP_020844786.1 sulfotransferase family cytosolic 2B member 1-like [Phascolarctos cinereus]XP_020844787.1 sulfotransferase family cytosolic 2B member 1-like [Phascolarctos cinereus]XP_020844788.1 sulfotransferase family cytosolic 2B member 1-like [Phascolarctos cinereus]